ncbi:DNA translocase FtsK [Clostridiaceae bacterium JG1575]|nr:DNA translocase FtsK [Clostridiaceae bacterium JG1575]
MAEPKRSRSTSARRSSTSQRTSRRSSCAGVNRSSSPFWEGYGNEVTGILFIGVGLLLGASVFTQRVGGLGRILKAAALSIFGTLGYALPLGLAALGLAFILRKRGFLWNKRGAGALLLFLALEVLLSVRHTHLLTEHSMGVALKIVSGLRETHGGSFGFLLTIPLVRLVGDVGAYIFAILCLFFAGVLMLNTTVYDSLKKGKDLTGAVNEKWRDKKEKATAPAQQEMTAPKAAGARPLLSAQKPEALIDATTSPPKEKRGFFSRPLFKRESSSHPKGGPASDEGLELPSFLKPATSGAGKGARRATPHGHFERFNIRLGKEPSRLKAPSDRPVAENPVTVPYLEGLNAVRDVKNPHVDDISLFPRSMQPAADSAEAPSRTEDLFVDEDFDAPVVYPEEEESLEDPAQAPEPEAPAPKAATPLTEFRKTHLAQTDLPKPTHGKQLSMTGSEAPEAIYRYPGVSLLRENMRGMMNDDDQHEIYQNAQKLQETLGTFGVEARVVDVSKGPSVTRYELQLKAGTKVSKVTNLSDDIALSLAASGVRIEAPIPGKAAVGIEIPNKETVPVFLREVIDSEKFAKSNQTLAMALGKDISGDIIIGDIARFPHVLIAGATGSGKSVCINSLIVSLLYKYSPKEVRLIMVDPKMVELSVYNGIPHLLIPVVTDPKKAAGALNWAVNEMIRRYDLFNQNSVRNIEGYNDLKAKGRIEEKLPYIVVIVDELADLMMVAAGEVESYIARLAQMARAAGMHLVIATQRPSVDVITGVIKANIPSRISFAVSSYVDSKTILDQGGAEKLLGKGDMLYSPMGAHKPRRVQGAFISEEEVESIVASIKGDQENVQYDESILEHIEKGGAPGATTEESDELFEEAVRIVLEYNQASTSFLQRRMRVGYNRASRIMEELEQRGVISGPDGSRPRKVLWSAAETEE